MKTYLKLKLKLSMFVIKIMDNSILLIKLRAAAVTSWLHHVGVGCWLLAVGCWLLAGCWCGVLVLQK